MGNSVSKRGGLKFASTTEERLVERAGMSKFQWQQLQQQEKQEKQQKEQLLALMGTGPIEKLIIHNKQELHLPKRVKLPEMIVDQHEPLFLRTQSELFPNNFKLWAG